MVTVEMKWSRLKQFLESRFCEALRKRLCLHFTHYRSNLHEPESRFWIALDSSEFYSVSKLKWLNELSELCNTYGYSYGQAESILAEQGKYYIDDYIDALRRCLSLPFEEALESDVPIIKALALVDRRLGKRRLKNIVIPDDAHPLVRKFYLLRCQVEGIKGEIKMTNSEQKILTFLLFTGQAEEAMNFYVSLFEQSEILKITRYEANQGGKEGTVLQGYFSLKGQVFMCTDSAVTHNFTYTPAMSLYVKCDTVEELEGVYKRIIEEGSVLMPLDAYPFSEKFCWVQDKFGVSWQLDLVKS